MKKVFLVLLLAMCFGLSASAANSPAPAVKTDNYSASQGQPPAVADSQLKELPPPESDSPSADSSAKDALKSFVSRDNFFQIDLYGINNWWNWTFTDVSPDQPYTPTGNNYGYLVGARLDLTKYIGLSYEYQSVKVNSAVPFITGDNGLTMVDNYNTVSDLNFLVKVTPAESPVQMKWLLGYRWNKLSSYGNYGNQSAGAYISLDGVQTGLLVESGKPIFGRIRPYARGEVNTVSWNFRPGLTVEAIPHVEIGAAYDYTSSFGVSNITYVNRQWLYGVTFRF